MLESRLEEQILSRKEAPMSPAAKEPDQSTYSGRFAARLRMLREKAGLSVDQVVAKMEKAGYELGSPTYYNWENGRRQVNWDAIPALAKTLRTKPTELIPTK